MTLFRCPYCEAVLTREEGETGRCPVCLHELVSRAGNPESPLALPSLTLSADPTLLSWHKASVGLSFVGYGASVALICYGLRLALTLLNADQFGSSRADPVALALDRLLQVLFVAGVTVLVLGSWLCYATPTNAGLRTWILALMAGQVMAALPIIALFVVNAYQDVDMGFGRRFHALDDIRISRTTVSWIECAALFFALLCKAAFSAFLMSLAGSLRVRGLRLGVVIYLLISTFFDLIFFGLFIVYSRNGTVYLFREMPALAWTRVVIYAVAGGCLVVLVFGARKAIRNRMLHTPSWNPEMHDAPACDS